MKKIFLALFTAVLTTAAAAQTSATTVASGALAAPAFAHGADVSWCTEMEAAGKRFYDADGQETELMTLMHQVGMNAIRLRVWVNPERDYGPWSDLADVLVKARRAHQQGLALMIDFHYSDFFADPGRQNKPAAWEGYSFLQLQQAVADHTRQVLQALKAEGIEPAWVQVGNETRSGMIWPDGKLWNGQADDGWGAYVALSNAGYEAVKAVCPAAQVIVHLDKAPEAATWFFSAFRQHGGKLDMIGLSLYPEGGSWGTDISNAAANVKALHAALKLPVMIAETGFTSTNESLAAQVMTAVFAQLKGLDGCAGIFYWEPELYGYWRPEAYVRWNWRAYDKGAFTSQGRPSAALNAFQGGNTAVTAPWATPWTAPWGQERSAKIGADRSSIAYDLSGCSRTLPASTVAGNSAALYIVRGRKIVVPSKMGAK